MRCSTEERRSKHEDNGSLDQRTGSHHWREYLQFALSEQARLRRESTFRYPTVLKVVRTLSNQQPANAADLQALSLDHLRALREDLRHGPTDGYKTFSNVDHQGRPTTPKPENDCRDILLDLIKPRLLQKSVNAEPEGHYADDKRADIKALFGLPKTDVITVLINPTK
jgi:hypothetical protein